MTATAPFSGKISAAKTALILVSLLAVWLGFVVTPSRKEAVKKIRFAESALAGKLHAVGLPENPDFEGLPEIFAIWAGQAEWKNNKTKFAYWHPVMKTYSYYLEATRAGGQFRFAEIARPRESADYYWDESLGEDCPIRFYYSVASKTLPMVSPSAFSSDPAGRKTPVMKLNLETPRIQVPKPELPSINSQPKR